MTTKNYIQGIDRFQEDNPETSWIDTDGTPLPEITIDPEYVKVISREEQSDSNQAETDARIQLLEEHIRSVDADNKRLIDKIALLEVCLDESKKLNTILLNKGDTRRTPSNQPLFPHYFRDVTGVSHIDIYWILQAWDVTNPSVQHAVKKLLVAGARGAKNKSKDLQEARDSITRALELEEVK